MVNYRRKWTVFLLLLSVILTSCLGPPKSTIPDRGDLSVTVQLPNDAGVARVTATLTGGGSGVVGPEELTMTGGVARGTITKLATGQWSILVRAYDASQTVIGSASSTVTVTKDKTAQVTLTLITGEWLNDPWLDERVIPAGESTTVRITVVVPRPASDLVTPTAVTSPVQLLAASGDKWLPLGYLFDDGDLDKGDEIKGDRVYSNYFTLHANHAGLLHMKLVVTAKDGTQHEKTFAIEVIEIDEAVVPYIINTHADAVVQLEAMPKQLSLEEMLDQLATWLTQHRPGVAQATRSGNVLQIDYTSGATSFIQLFDETDPNAGMLRGGGERRNNPLIPLYEQTRGVDADVMGLLAADMLLFAPAALGDDENVIGSRQVLVWAPFAAEFAPWDETDGVVELLAESNLGFEVTVMRNEMATVESLRSITDYGMVILATHGAGGRWIATGEKFLDDPDKYIQEVLRGRMAIWDGMKVQKAGAIEIKWSVWAVQDTWLADNLKGTFPNSVILNNSCQSTVTDGLWNVFNNAGAGAYFGYDANVSSRFAVERAHAVVKHMRVSTNTTGESYALLRDPYDDENFALWEMEGNWWLRFASGMLNNDFENGLAGWHTVGDGRIILGLGHLQPTKGQHMAIISTGLGFSRDMGAVSQKFQVPHGATTMAFDWNFLSEEFLEFIDSRYQDSFIVDLIHDGKKTTVLAKTIDDIAADFGATYCGDSPTDCMAEGKSGRLVHVSPGIVFDQGDVWMTDWVSGEYPIAQFAGEVIALSFAAYDVGDSLYDSAVLIDNIRFR